MVHIIDIMRLLELINDHNHPKKRAAQAENPKILITEPNTQKPLNEPEMLHPDDRVHSVGAEVQVQGPPLLRELFDDLEALKGVQILDRVLDHLALLDEGISQIRGVIDGREAQAYQ